MPNNSGPIQESSTEPVCAPLRHPLRARILEVTNEREISPIQFVNEGLEPPGVIFRSQKNAISHVAYHFRELEKAGCIEVVDRWQRRGATEHIYRGRATLFFDTADFEKMTMEEREKLSRVTLQSIFARADSALRAGTFDARADRHVTWKSLTLDKRGWQDLMADMETWFYRVMEIQQESSDRIAASDDEIVSATCAMLGFHSPPPTLPPDDDRASDPR